MWIGVWAPLRRANSNLNLNSNLNSCNAPRVHNVICLLMHSHIGPMCPSSCPPAPMTAHNKLKHQLATKRAAPSARRPVPESPQRQGRPPFEQLPMVFGFKVHTNTKLDQREILFFIVKTAAFPIMTVPADEFELNLNSNLNSCDAPRVHDVSHLLRHSHKGPICPSSCPAAPMTAHKNLKH